MVRYLPFPVMPISIKAVIEVRRASPGFFFSCLKLTMEQRARQKSNCAFLTSVQSHSRRFLLFTHIHNWGTLLAASTLAHTASIAALSSRRLAFFSFALLDFLWRHKMNGEGKKAGDIWWITDGSERHFSPWHRHKKCKILRSLQTKRCYNPLPFFYHLIYSLLCFAWSVPAIFHHFFTGESIFSCQRV